MNRRTGCRIGTIAIAIGLSGLLMASGTSAASPQQSKAATATVIAAQVPVGQAVYVAVKTNPSTGYHWQVRPVAGITVSSTDYPTKKVDPQHPMVGVPVMRIYQFTAAQASVTPYIVQLVELTPAGQPSGTNIVVTIAAQS